MRVRRASEADVDAIARVLRDSFAEFERLYTREGFAATALTPARLAARWADGPVWLAESANDIVGTVGACQREGGVYVRSMAVLPSARGRGAARELMREVERFAASGHAPRLYLSTTPFLFDAIRLYESLGFRRTGEPPHDLAGTPLVTLEKHLRRA